MTRFDAALAVAPGSIPARFNRGLALRALGRHGEAAAAFLDVAARRPDLAEAAAGFAAVLAALTGMGEAERRAMGAQGRAGVLASHTAAHRASELEGYIAEARRR